MIKQLLAAFSGQNSRQPASPRGSKIAVGCGAVHHFIHQIHSHGIDRVTVIPYDYAILMDRSGSMAENA